MDALTEKGDEGRGLAAIRFGEVLCNLRSEDFRMGKPPSITQCVMRNDEVRIMNYERRKIALRFFCSRFNIRYSLFLHRALRDARILYSNEWRKQTSGSETSQYREEQKTIVIPLVAASETGEAQTQPLKLASRF